MITIIKDPNADSRAVEGENNIRKTDLLIATKNHIKDVNEGMKFFSKMLLKAGKNHDHTKLDYFHDFSELVSNGVKNERFKKSEWYHKHITEERHHLNAHIPDNINLIDILEFITDCTMAGLSRSGEIWDLNIPNEVLQLAFNNTAKLLKDNVIVKEKEEDDILDKEI